MFPSRSIAQNSTTTTTHTPNNNSTSDYQRTLMMRASAPPAQYDVQPTTQTHPRGFNKGLRDSTKLLLGLTALFLFGKYNGCAVLSSSASLYTIKKGTLMSTKNLKWGALALISWLVASTGYAWQEGKELVETNHRYRHSNWKLIIWFWAEFIQVFWSMILAFFVVSAWKSKNNFSSQAQSSQPNPIYTATTGINPHYKQE